MLCDLGRTDLAPAAGTKILIHKYMFTNTCTQKTLYTNTCTQIHVHKYMYTNTRSQIQVYIRLSNLYQDQTKTRLDSIEKPSNGRKWNAFGRTDLPLAADTNKNTQIQS